MKLNIVEFVPDNYYVVRTPRNPIVPVGVYPQEFVYFTEYQEGKPHWSTVMPMEGFEDRRAWEYDADEKGKVYESKMLVEKRRKVKLLRPDLPVQMFLNPHDAANEKSSMSLWDDRGEVVMVRRVEGESWDFMVVESPEDCGFVCSTF